MSRLPESCDLRALGLDEAEAEAASAEMIHQRHGNRLYRVSSRGRSFVIKWFEEIQASEIQAYALLEELAVPTIRLHGRTENALLLEDLAVSAEWRLATEDEMNSSSVGAAVARWYLQLHAAGERLPARPENPPGFLGRETDTLNAEVLWKTGKKLCLTDLSGWRLAVNHLELLQRAVHSLAETLNYNDFYWGNLALSRRPGSSLSAIVFDYHLLGIGLRYSDCRNVTSSLGDEAAAAFRATYGPVDEREKRLDKPLSILVTLTEAAKRSRFPEWAADSLKKARNGELERSLCEALERL